MASESLISAQERMRHVKLLNFRDQVRSETSSGGLPIYSICNFYLSLRETLILKYRRIAIPIVYLKTKGLESIIEYIYNLIYKIDCVLLRL